MQTPVRQKSQEDIEIILPGLLKSSSSTADHLNDLIRLATQVGARNKTMISFRRIRLISLQEPKYSPLCCPYSEGLLEMSSDFRR